MDAFDSFTLAPLSAGDIIDRAVRLYRRHFVTLLRIVLLPSLIAYAGGIASAVGWRNLSQARGDGQLAFYLTLAVIGVGTYLLGHVAFFALLGGTSRVMVGHLLDGAPLRARDAYRAVRERFWALIGATLIVLLSLGVVLSIVNLVVLVVLGVYLSGSVWLLRGWPGWAQALTHLTFAALFGGLLVAVFLLIYGWIAYLPQALMVERRGVFSAVGRSFSLAYRSILRIGAVLLFGLYVTWSVLLLLVIPLGWYAYLSGVDVSPFSADKPLWYTISYQTLTQLSEVLLAPIAMLGFTQLYIDSRVRKEGFDIELLADRCLPAVSYEPSAIRPTAPHRSPFPSILGLSDFRPVPRTPAEEKDQIVRRAEPAGQNHGEPRSCQGCGTAAAPEDRFCRKCGALQPEEAEVRG